MKLVEAIKIYAMGIKTDKTLLDFLNTEHGVEISDTSTSESYIATSCSVFRKSSRVLSVLIPIAYILIASTSFIHISS